jgi:hypothetical protein
MNTTQTNADLTATMKQIAVNSATAPRPPEPSKPDDLQRLAIDIKFAHKAITDAGRNIVAKAIEAGDLLNRAKAQVGHGGFLDWVKANCGFTDKTAQRYMKFAENKEHLEKATSKFETISNLTLNKAEAAIKEAKQAAKEAAKGNGSGEQTNTDGQPQQTGKGRKKNTDPPKPSTVYTTKQEELIDALREFTSVEHAEEYAAKTKQRLDETIAAWRKEMPKAA